jgi:putative NADH-flavin reductase
MQITVLGVSGGVGGQFTKLALQKGHQVIGVTRHPESVTLAHPGLKVVRGDVSDPDSLISALQGSRAAVCAVGSGGLLQARKPTRLYSTTARTLLTAMETNGVSRLLAVTAGGIVPNKDWPWFYRLLIHPMLREMYADMHRMEDLIKVTAIRHLFIRPVRLVAGEPTGKYRVANEITPAGGFLIRQGDVADYLVKRLEADDYQSGGIGIAY